MNLTHAREIAGKLNKQEREITIALCGNAWQGTGRPSPGILVMNAHGLMHIDAMKDREGRFLRYKAKPTDLGMAVREELKP